MFRVVGLGFIVQFLGSGIRDWGVVSAGSVGRRLGRLLGASS